MTAYIIRRLIYAIPIILGVNIVTFLLFFMVNPPQDQARKALGSKNVTPELIANYLHEKGYDKPRFFNRNEAGLQQLTQTIFYQKFFSLLRFEFGNSDSTGDPIGLQVYERMWASLCITAPALLIGLFLNIFFSMLVAYYRGTYLDIWGVVVCVILMSVSVLYYIIGLQYFIGKEWKLIPISGWGRGFDTWRFALGPVLISVMWGVGAGVRFYRTIFLEELGKDYIRTARSKGLSEMRVLYGHGLRNALIPILTSVVTSLPLLIMGSLILENFFAIPGLGNYTIEALHAADFAVVRAMVFLGALLFIGGLILTDISYAFADPRISFIGGRAQSRMWTVFAGVFVFLLIMVVIGHFTDPLREGMEAVKQSVALEREAELALSPAARKAREHTWNTVGVVTGNALAILVVGLIFAGIYFASRREYWRIAWRQVRVNRLAMVSLAVILLYAFVALLDSIAWRDHVLDPAGKVVVDADGNPEPEQKAKTLLDRAWVLVWSAVVAPRPELGQLPMRKVADCWETTYSAPLADTHFQKTTNPDTGKREHTPLKFPGAHLFGTNEAGADTFYRCLKGVRTGLIIGLVTTLIALPFALILGILAGYRGGWADDLVQYIYTTLGSIPGVLLIMGFILIFGQGLWQVCVILGVRGWVTLCRLLRGETLKLRELDYIQAARALGAGNLAVMRRHLLPNLMHIVLINSVLSFSGLVLAEATLTYIGIGVGPETGSWGNMINSARMELARDPIIYWSLISSFVFMFLLILAANLFADAMRDALDPRLRIK